MVTVGKINKNIKNKAKEEKDRSSIFTVNILFIISHTFCHFTGNLSHEFTDESTG